MSSLSPKRTWLPFVVWISPQGAARHDVRVKVSGSPETHPDEFTVVAITPQVRVIHGPLTSEQFGLLEKWIELNRQALIDFREGRIEYTEDVMSQLKSIN